MEFHPVLERLDRFLAEKPVISEDVYIAPDATILGKVSIRSESSVWFQSVIRADIIDRDVHIPEGTTIGFDPESDRQKYFVTDSGITVVTRDYSLFENPVTVDYFTSE